MVEGLWTFGEGRLCIRFGGGEARRRVFSSSSRSCRPIKTISKSIGIVFQPLVWINQDLVCRLNRLELCVGFHLSAWVPIRMIFKS